METTIESGIRGPVVLAGYGTFSEKTSTHGTPGVHRDYKKIMGSLHYIDHMGLMLPEALNPISLSSRCKL